MNTEQWEDQLYMHKTWNSDRLDILEYYTAYVQYITKA